MTTSDDHPSEQGSPTGPVRPEPPAAPPHAAASHPFAPVARPPRAPWVNPERRGQVVAWGVVGALVLLGAGFGIGYAAGGDGGGRGEHGRFERGGYGPMPGMGNRYGWGPGRHPGGPPVLPTPTALPATSGTPSPSATK